MLVKIQISKKQYKKLHDLIINQKLEFAIVDSGSIAPINGNDYEVVLNVYSGDPGALFDLGQRFKSIPDSFFLGT